MVKNERVSSMKFIFLEIFGIYISSQNLKTKKRQSYSCLLSLINQIPEVRDGINSVILDAVNDCLNRADIVGRLANLMAGHSEVINSQQKIFGHESLDPAYISQIKSDLNSDNLYYIAKVVLNGYVVDDFEIRSRVGRVGGFEFSPINSEGSNLGSEESDKDNSTVEADDFEARLDSNEEQAERVEKQSRLLEKSFYEPVRQWAIKHNDGANCFITGGKLPFPKWENPDLVQIDFEIGNFTKKIEFEITSFEVKLRVEPYAVWQAANYKRFSSYVYVVFAKSEKEVREKDEGRVFDIAVDLGVGILVLEGSNSSGDHVFKEIHAPARNRPLDIEVNKLLKGYSGIEEVKLIVSSAERQLRPYIFPDRAQITFLGGE